MLLHSSLVLAGDPSFLDYASKGGVIGLALIILYGGFKEKPWWVYGWVYREVVDRNTQLTKEQERLVAIASRQTNIVETLAEGDSKVTK
jgi:hypothetical protein